MFRTGLQPVRAKHVNKTGLETRTYKHKELL